jgi:hypothetical protein
VAVTPDDERAMYQPREHLVWELERGLHELTQHLRIGHANGEEEDRC